MAARRLRDAVILPALGALALAAARMVSAHHSYAMFDSSAKLSISGTVAKLEWANPHVFVWMYVPSRDSPGKFDLYAFENGSVNTLTRLGWSATVLKTGDRITVEYWPLKDGRMGGAFDSATLADGRVLPGATGVVVKGAPRKEFELPRLEKAN